MQRRNLGWLAMMSAALLALGCGGKAASTPTLVGNVPKPVVAAALDDLAYLPINSDIVSRFDVAQLRSSALYRELIEPKITASLDGNATFAAFKARCGFDPMQAVSSFAVGAHFDPAAGESNVFDAVLVVHGFQKAQVLACVEKSKDSGAAGYRMEGDVFVIESPNNQVARAQFVDANTLVFQYGTVLDGAAAFRRVIAGAHGVNSSPAFMDLYGKTAGTLRFLVNGSLPQLRKTGSTVKAMFGSLQATDVAAFDMHMRMGSDAEATQIVSALQAQLGAFQNMVTKLNVSAENSDIVATVVVNAAQLANLFSMFGGMLGGAGG